MSQFFKKDAKNSVQIKKIPIRKYPKTFPDYQLQEKCDLQERTEKQIIITFVIISFLIIPIIVGIFDVGAAIALIVYFVFPFTMTVIPGKIKKLMIGLYALILLLGISIFSLVVDSPYLIILGIFVAIMFSILCNSILNRVENSKNSRPLDYKLRNHFSFFTNEETIKIMPELMDITKTHYDALKQKNIDGISPNWRNLRVGTTKNLVLTDIQEDIDRIYEKSKLAKPIILIADNYLEQRLMANQILFGSKIQNKILGILLQPSKYALSRFIQKRIKEQTIQQTGNHQNISPSTLLKIQIDNSSYVFSSLNQIASQRKDPLAYIDCVSDEFLQMISPVRKNNTESYVHDTIENQTKIKIEKLDEAFVDQKFSTFYHSGFLDLYDVLDENNIIKNEVFKRYLNVLRKGVYEIFFFDTCVILSRLPTKISMDDDDKLHSLTKPAIEWMGLKDEFYYIHGVQFEKKLWMKITKRIMSVSGVLKIRNIEQRYIALQIYGVEKILSELDTKLIDESARGNKLYKLEGLAAKKTFKLLKYSCPSTSREYISFVPDYINTADSGMAWKFQITEDEYSQLRIEA